MTPNRSDPKKPHTFTRDHGVFCPGEPKRLKPNQSTANRKTNPAVGIKAAGSCVTSGGLYGTTSQGRLYGNGTIFKLTPQIGASASWTETVLQGFNRVYDRGGVDPNGALIQDPSGNLYGTASSGGHGVGGVVFKVAAP